MLECVLDNNHCIGERREMSTQSLPAASLRTGNRLPAGRVLLQVSKYLVWMALSSIYSSIRGAVSIFLPEAGRPGVPRLGLRAAASGRVVGVLALAQHHPDRGAGQVEIPAQREARGLRESTGTPSASIRRGVSQANADGVLLPPIPSASPRSSTPTSKSKPRIPLQKSTDFSRLDPGIDGLPTRVSGESWVG